MKIDLHCHSTCSDGTFSPTQVVEKAGQACIEVLALTDHDTTAGINEAKAAAVAQGITLINGVEISCEHTLSGGYGKHQNHTKIIHVVGLGFDDMDKMSETLAQLQQSRANRGRAIVAKLAQILPTNDFDVNEDDLWQKILAKADGNPQAVGRSHIAQVLKAIGAVSTIQQAFDKYLADNKSAYVKIDALTMQKGIELIHACGGRAVLAHPTRYNLSATRVRKLIEAFKQLGGDACELPATCEPISKRQMIDRAIAQHDLMVSVASDFHGASMPWRRLGDVPKKGAEQVGVWEQFI
ncbi:PHP domain-containing protein [Psychrobacter sp. HD31]|uniref:PHP domain-containing protein n=1 Tax=Psychrobacter sp. HD31 TaxID=3112003 RepID=UPI003DA1E964